MDESTDTRETVQITIFKRQLLYYCYLLMNKENTTG